jgi:Tol biopolymer transport system component
MTLIISIIGLAAFAVTIHADESEVTTEIITHEGGRVAWSEKLQLLAFDRMGDDGYFDMWIMRPDGSGQKNMTSGKPALPGKHTGNPEWHPSGKFILFQAQKNVETIADTKATPGAGALNDLWVMTRNGKKVWKVYTVKLRMGKNAPGVLHAQFNSDGSQLLWSERVSGKGRTFGEWVMRLADFSINKKKGPKLSNIRTYNPGGIRSFFETHDWDQNDAFILFTSTHNGGLDLYEMNPKTRRLIRHTFAPEIWDEQAHFSPEGGKIIWMSSRDLIFQSDPFFLQSDLWMMNRDGTNKERITWFNEPGHPHYLGEEFVVVGDFEWLPDGKTLYALCITHMPDTDDRGRGPIVKITLP